MRTVTKKKIKKRRIIAIRKRKKRKEIIGQETKTRDEPQTRKKAGRYLHLPDRNVVSEGENLKC